MTTIANLSVSLSARVGKFEKGFKKATRTIKRFGRNLDKSTAGLRRIATVGTAIAVAGLGALVKKQFSTIDSTAKLSRTIGLATEQLAGYQYAIGIAGGDQEGFNKAIIRMNRSIADAQAGLSTAIREFDRVGVSVDELASLSTDQRIKLLADRYLSIGDAAGKASFLLNLFGRQGASIGNLFERGAEGIQILQNEAEELGLTFNAFDAAKIEQANDSFLRMKSVIVGASRSIAIRLAPFVTAVSIKLKEMGMQGGDMGKTVFNAFNNILRIVGRLADYFELLKSVWFGFQSVILTGAALILKPINALGEHIAKVINLIPNMSVEFNSVTKDLEESFGNAALSATDKMQTAFDKFYSGENSSKAALLFEDISKRAEEAAKSATSSLGLPDLGEENQSSDKSAFAKAIDLSKVVVGNGSTSNKGTTQAQGESIIYTLKQIAENTSSGMAVVS